jgi:hypothetical protein
LVERDLGDHFLVIASHTGSKLFTGIGLGQLDAVNDPNSASFIGIVL